MLKLFTFILLMLRIHQSHNMHHNARNDRFKSSHFPIQAKYLLAIIVNGVKDVHYHLSCGEKLRVLLVVLKSFSFGLFKMELQCFS